MVVHIVTEKGLLRDTNTYLARITMTVVSKYPHWTLL